MHSRSISVVVVAALTLVSVSVLVGSGGAVGAVGSVGSVGDDQADAAWGQSSFATNANPTCSSAVVASSGSLCQPGLTVTDSAGNLWVVDYGDSRVLMYPPSSSGVPAATPTKVLGQTSMSGASCNQGGAPSATTLCKPWGITIDSSGTLYVADDHNNRILVYPNAATYNGNDQPASLVLGQPTFSQNAANNPSTNGGSCPSVGGGASQCTLYYPNGLTLDAQGDLLVADYLNNRVLVWKAATLAAHRNDTCTTGCYISADGVWGQGGFQSFGGNQANTTPNPSDPTCPTTSYQLQIPASNSQPEDIVTGPDGDVWFTDIGSNSIWRVTQTGAFTQDPIPTPNSEPERIASADGYLWFTESTGNKIGRVNPANGHIDEYQVNTPNSRPFGIAAGPDGHVWFTEVNTGTIGYVDPASGQVYELFHTPNASSGPFDMVAGVDGNLWFAEGGNANQIARITPSGLITEFALPAGVGSLTAATDGSIWFVDEMDSNVGRLTPSGAVTEFRFSGDNNALTAGPDGNVWVAQWGQEAVSRVTQTGAVTEFPIPGAAHPPNRITTGPDGEIWFTEGGTNGYFIGRISPSGSFGGPTTCTLANPTSVSADARGDLFVADTTNNRVLEYNDALSSNFGRQAATMVYGQQGSLDTNVSNWGGTSATSLNQPWAVGVDPAGNPWVADWGNNRVLEYPSITSTNRANATTAVGVLGQQGSFTANAPNSDGLDALSLNGPSSIGFDNAGNAYVAEWGNNRVLEFAQPYPVTARIALGAGWNLVSLPSATTMPYTAATIVAQINQQGGNATALAVYGNGRYTVYVPRYSKDFAISPTQGFFVLAGKGSVWAVT